MPNKNHDFFPRLLKSVSVEQLEEAIADAIGKLAGKEYTAHIEKIDFNSSEMACLHDVTEITLRLSQVQELGLFEQKKEDTSG